MDERSSAEPSPVRPLTIRVRNAILLGAAALAATVLMTWPLAAGMGHLGRTQNSGDGRFAVWNVAWVAHALDDRPGGSLRRQHLLSASTGARLLRSQHRRRHARRAGLGRDAQPVRRAQLGRALRVRRLGRLHLAARPAAHRRRRRRGDCGGPLRVLPVRLLAHRAHPAADGRRHSALPARVPPAGRRAVAGARRRARPRARRAGDVVRVLRRLGRPDGRLRHALLRLVPAAVDVAPVLDRDRHCGRLLGRNRAAVLPALPRRSRTRPALRARSTMPGNGRRTCARISPPARTHTRGCCPLIRDWNGAVLFPGFLSIGLGVAGAAIALAPPRVAAPHARTAAARP